MVPLPTASEAQGLEPQTARVAHASTRPTTNRGRNP
jgi:hypothetical protein